jgi:hypothetical protein
VCNFYGITHQELLHLGDNYDSDYITPLKIGINSFNIPSEVDQLLLDGRLNQEAISQLLCLSSEDNGGKRNLFASYILAYLAKEYSYKKLEFIDAIFGSMYAGPLISGFATWIKNVTNEDGVDHIFFAERDGYITKKIWDILGFPPDMASVFHVSRRTTIIPYVSHSDISEIRNAFFVACGASLKSTIEKLCLSSEKEIILILSEFIDVEKSINSNKELNEIITLITSKCSRQIYNDSSEEAKAYNEYLRMINFNANTAIVDCGWALTTQKHIERITGYKFRGYYIGSSNNSYQHDKIRTFLFSGKESGKWQNVLETALEVLELPFLTNEKQICKFEQNICGVFPIMTDCNDAFNNSRSDFIHGMQDSACTFAKEVKEFMPVFTIDEIKDVIIILIYSLAKNPTKFEYYWLGKIPHDGDIDLNRLHLLSDTWLTGCISRPSSK